jgi:hypothetical protein
MQGANSVYIQICKYAMIEYIYSDTPIFTNSVKPFKLTNGYTDETLFLNNAISINTTGNVLSTSVSRLGLNSNAWVYHDPNAIIPVLQRDPQLGISDLTSILGPVCNYDTVRIHLLAGYDFNGVDGFIFESKCSDNSSLVENVGLCSNVFFKNDATIQNASPLFMGDRLYDKYIEKKIPSLSFILFQQESNGVISGDIGYEYTNGNIGINPLSRLKLSLIEIDLIRSENDNKILITGEEFHSWVNPVDQFSYVQCVIRQNNEWDYIEYYPTYKGQFIEDYINLLNQSGNWIVINQLEVLEQAGTTLLRTYSGTLMQDSNFDEPQLYRPIIRNSAYIYSFTINYTMRLVNKSTNTEIIKRSSFTSLEPKKYGMKMEKLNLLTGFTPVKVYNKIIEKNLYDKNDLSPIFQQPQLVKTKYRNNYIQTNNIVLSGTVNSQELTTVNQGEMYIGLSPYDNLIQFRLYKKTDIATVVLDISTDSNTYKLAFKTDIGEDIKIEQKLDNVINPANGELLFQIERSIVQKLLSITDKKFWIINEQNNIESVLYWGTFGEVTKITKVDTIVPQELIKPVQTIQAPIEDINKNLSDIESAIKRSNANGTDINIPEIPGITTLLGSNAIKDITPAI